MVRSEGEFLPVLMLVLQDGKGMMVETHTRVETQRGIPMAKKAKKSKKRATRKKASGKGGSSSAGLRNASAGELQAELQRRARDLAPLESERAKLLEKVALLDAEIGAINGALGAGTPGTPSTPGRAGRRPVGRPKGSVNKVRKATRTRAASGRRRPRNAASLEASLAKVLKGKTMGVSEVAAAVQKDGYKTTSANFRTIVNQTLIKSALIKKTGRGQYTAK